MMVMYRALTRYPRRTPAGRLVLRSELPCQSQALSTATTATTTSQVERVDASATSPSEFQEQFVHRKASRRPCIVHGLSLGEIDLWTVASFRDSFASAEMWDKDQLQHKNVRDYLADETQLNPAGGTTGQESYLFEFLGAECGPPCSDHASRILESYEPPEQFFGPDLWKLGAGNDYLATLERPEHRWLLVGKEGSGSGLHVDPNGTCAWNKSIVGRKRWAMFPPVDGDPFFVDSACGSDPVDSQLAAVEEVSFSKFKVDEFTDNPVRNALVHAGLLSARELFGFVETTQSKAQDGVLERKCSPEAKPVWDRPDWQGPSPCCDFIQHPGEIVFVPAGFWHAVVNLDTTIAITQNFSPPCDADRVLDELARHPGGRTIAARWAARFAHVSS